MSRLGSILTDPFKLQKAFWPHITFYDKQAEVIESVWANDDTIVHAGNELGKDFVAAFIAVAFFCSRSPARVVTHSIDQPQLKGVLWGEIRRFIQTAKYPLPFEVNDLMIHQVRPDGTREPLSYLIGRVTRKGEGMLGHHLSTPDKRKKPRTLFIADEASGVDQEAWDRAETWANRRLSIGNPLPSTSNTFFHGAIEEGSIIAG